VPQSPRVSSIPRRPGTAAIALPFAIALGMVQSALGQPAAITVHNASTVEICSLFVSAPDGEAGADRLGEDETIAPGASRAFDVGPGPWNVLATDCEDGAIVDYGFRLRAGAEMTVGREGAVPVMFRNSREERICEVTDGADNLLPHWADPTYPSSREFMPVDPGEAAWIFLTPGVHTLAARSCERETVQYGQFEVPRQTVWNLGGQAAAECQARAAPRRILGLERLYFRRIEGATASDASVAQSIGASALRPLIPETLRDGPRYWQPFAPGEHGRDLTVQDFPLPTSGAAAEWFLREVTDTSSRLTEEWWVVYENGCRVDAWYFTPEPALTENKLLTAIAVAGLARPEPDRLVLSVAGRMDRPGGAWWEMSGDLVFGLDPGGATFERVAHRTAVGQDYDREGVPVTLGAVVETDVTRDGRAMVEIRSRARIPRRRAEPCLAAAGEGKAAAAVAECLVAGPGAEIQYRALDEPSPIERRR
jgi:hypothetical protein